MSKHPQIL